MRFASALPQCGHTTPLGQTRVSSHSRALVSSVKIGFWRLASDMGSSYADTHTRSKWLCQGYNPPKLSLGKLGEKTAWIWKSLEKCKETRHHFATSALAHPPVSRAAACGAARRLAGNGKAAADRRAAALPFYAAFWRAISARNSGISTPRAAATLGRPRMR